MGEPLEQLAARLGEAAEALQDRQKNFDIAKENLTTARDVFLTAKAALAKALEGLQEPPAP